MASRKDLVNNLRDEISKVERRLGRTSLARCKKGAQRDFLARDFIKRFKGVPSEDFEETLQHWMDSDRPDPLSVQTVLQVMVEVSNERFIDTILDCIDTRIAGGLSPADRSESRAERAVKDAWWGDCVLEPFENTFAKTPRLRRRVQYLVDEARKQSQVKGATS